LGIYLKYCRLNDALLFLIVAISFGILYLILLFYVATIPLIMYWSYQFLIAQNMQKTIIYKSNNDYKSLICALGFSSLIIINLFAINRHMVINCLF